MLRCCYSNSNLKEYAKQNDLNLVPIKLPFYYEFFLLIVKLLGPLIQYDFLQPPKKPLYIMFEQFKTEIINLFSEDQIKRL